jgi:hypothetical protein
MSITLNTLVYNQDSFINANKVKYTGPEHTFTTKDEMYLSRVAPKPTNDFDGVARSTVKSVKTVEINSVTGETHDAIIETTFNFPVGMTSADADALRDQHGDFLISADAGTLSNSHDLTY